MVEPLTDNEETMRVTKSLYWNDIPGFSELMESCPSMVEDMVSDKDMLDEFIARDDPHNPTDIAAYISRFRGIVLVYYLPDTDAVRFVNILPANDHNKKYVIYKLSSLGVPAGMVPRY